MGCNRRYCETVDKRNPGKVRSVYEHKTNDRGDSRADI